jgi:hypothetical protein
MGWRAGQRFDKDGCPAVVVRVTSRADHGLLVRRQEDGRPAVAVDWESVERLPDGSPRCLGRMIR